MQGSRQGLIEELNPQGRLLVQPLTESNPNRWRSLEDLSAGEEYMAPLLKVCDGSDTRRGRISVGKETRRIWNFAQHERGRGSVSCHMKLNRSRKADMTARQILQLKSSIQVTVGLGQGCANWISPLQDQTTPRVGTRVGLEVMLKSPKLTFGP